MGEFLSLKNIRICIVGGREEGDGVFITDDHLYPKSLIKQPRKLRPIRPFLPLVADPANVFPVCWRHHKQIDYGKMTALGINVRGGLNPKGLIGFIRDCYPITSDPNFRDLQLRCMIRATGLFIDAVGNLRSQLPRSLIDRYHAAREEAFGLREKLATILSRG